MLAKRLKEIRQLKGVNQQEVAEYLGVKRQTYSAYERSISIPDSLVLKKLADFFEISIEEFFLNATNQTQQEQEKQLMLLARRSRQIPSEHREKLIKNFEDNLDIYLSAMEFKDEYMLEYGKEWEKNRD